ncbi:hypothetical protein N9097_00510 [bacterium]|nr:hypothetical protein [bacterium]
MGMVFPFTDERSSRGIFPWNLGSFDLPSIRTNTPIDLNESKVAEPTTKVEPQAALSHVLTNMSGLFSSVARAFASSRSPIEKLFRGALSWPNALAAVKLTASRVIIDRFIFFP